MFPLLKIKADGDKAIRENDKTLLIRINEEIQELQARAIFSNPASWLYQFGQLSSGAKKFTNEKEAQYFIEKGKRAIELNDVDELKRCVQNLMLLLPVEEQEEIKNNE